MFAPANTKLIVIMRIAKAAAMKYLDGRKKAYSHLFTEISPQIPKEYEPVSYTHLDVYKRQV